MTVIGDVDRPPDDDSVSGLAHEATLAAGRSMFEDGSGLRVDPDRLLDRVLPEALDWRAAVRRWPLPAMAVCCAAGWLLARRRGPAVVDGMRSGASALLGERWQELQRVLEEGGPGSEP